MLIKHSYIVRIRRYTAEHAKVHHATTGHPYSLELSTGRIWDYRLVYIYMRFIFCMFEIIKFLFS